MIKSKIKITGTILSALAGILIVMQVKASGGEAMEGSQLEQFERNGLLPVSGNKLGLWGFT